MKLMTSTFLTLTLTCSYLVTPVYGGGVGYTKPASQSDYITIPKVTFIKKESKKKSKKKGKGETSGIHHCTAPGSGSVKVSASC